MEVSPQPSPGPKDHTDLTKEELEISRPHIWVPFPRDVISPEVEMDDPLRGFFGAQIESVMCEMGIASPHLCEYLTELLVNYIKADGLASNPKLKVAPGNVITLLVEGGDSRLSRAEAF